MIKAEDIKMMEAQLNAAIDETIASNGTKESSAVDNLMANFTGPATGLEYRNGRVVKANVYV